MRVYIAGPMRGYALYNFPEFDRAAERWRAAGHDPINPAELDRAAGFNPARDKATPQFVRMAIGRDLAAIAHDAEAIALLPGWRESAGVRVELALARLLKLGTYCADTLQPIDTEAAV